MTGADTVLETLRRHVLVDGLDLVVDLERSHGSMLVDARSGVEYLDLVTFFGSLPLGMNHPAMAQDTRFMADLGRAALHKVANTGFYTAEYARFVETFTRVVGDPELPRFFFIDGGALAVENALKVAFDWKAQRVGAHSGQELMAMHVTGAFHGCTGYTMSLTNVDDPKITDRYPQWEWPRIALPGPDSAADALRTARDIFEQHGDRIACFIAEPILGSGGDIHLSGEFLAGMQGLCREYDALFVLDEVQTGCGFSGTPWVYQQLGLEPDIVAFGKKTQVCGIMAGRRVDLVPENALVVSARLGSTWGGNLADMVRATRVLEIMENDSLVQGAADKGKYLLAQLQGIAEHLPELLTNPRGRGLICAFDLPSGEIRNEVVERLRTEEHTLLRPSGARSVRIRPSLAVTTSDLDRGVRAISRVLQSM
ncbi:MULTISPECIES: L-lysine 6-transaminase [unclassified Streptomyces]|uniref:L-lysine 6-transaminase n=1 Tax=unclassified Streptomyces TaxID=2593676 RepID=UPI00381F2249